MSSDGTWLVLPTTLGRQAAALDAVLFGWAMRRNLSTLACRAAGPAAIPGTEYDVWCLQLLHVPSIATAAADLSFGVRATVALRAVLQVGTGVALVFRDGTLAHRTAAENGAPAPVEAAIAEGLAAFAGPIEVLPGWLAPWLSRCDAAAELRVIRWNGARPTAPSWPAGYTVPTARDCTVRLDDDVDRSLVVRALAAVTGSLVARLRELEIAQATLTHDRSLDSGSRGALAGARLVVESAEQALLAVVRSAVGPWTVLDDLVLGALQTVLEAGGVPRRRVRAALKRMA